MPRGLSVVIPFRATTPERERSRAFVEDWLYRTLGDPDTVLADDPGPDFNRGRALNAGAGAATGDTLVFADADLVVPGDVLLGALRAVEAGAALVVPFSSVLGLGEAATEGVLSVGRPPWGPWDDSDIEYRWNRLSTGGINVLRRTTFETAGGFDERFAGWGYEDAAFASAVETLVGPLEWLDGAAVHLWHPRDPTRRGDLPSVGRELVGRYSAAWGDAAAMKALIASR